MCNAETASSVQNPTQAPPGGGRARTTQNRDQKQARDNHRGPHRTLRKLSNQEDFQGFGGPPPPGSFSWGKREPIQQPHVGNGGKTGVVATPLFGPLGPREPFFLSPTGPPPVGTPVGPPIIGGPQVPPPQQGGFCSGASRGPWLPTEKCRLTHHID
ncbi:proline-rich proteoglycan 2-like [Penaeus monodon]|uniref:proline-rich proteoglycan 2-like n=1 Tax=Penaeus monodon TaxID=6687 RepID=UPI0018A6F375|nr:proline-rich proteoglycan 2-like [Penaeus monodon]